MKTAFRHVGASGGENVVEERGPGPHERKGDGAMSLGPTLRVSLPPLHLFLRCCVGARAQEGLQRKRGGGAGAALPS